MLNTHIMVLPLLVFLALVPGILSSERVRLENVKALTLHDGRYTTSRRSSPVPQLRCVGGSAGCAYKPKVVQCVNVGSDGFDVQWECKADMSKRYRFGRIQVNCEGYDHPNDKDVLRGSCGLEYELDLTESSSRKRKNSNFFSVDRKSGSGGMLGIVGFVAAILLIYCVCLRGSHQDQRVPPRDPPPYPGTDTGYPSGPDTGYPSGPPPPGFRPEYTSTYDDCGTRYRASAPPAPDTGAGAGGFWTGAALGGLTGYLFGSSGNTDRHYSSYHAQERVYPDISSYRRDSSSDRDEPRMTSGFGGTSRR